MRARNLTAGTGSLLVFLWAGALLLMQLFTLLITPYLDKAWLKYAWMGLHEILFLLGPLFLLRGKQALAPIHKIEKKTGEWPTIFLSALLAGCLYPLIMILQNFWQILMETLGIRVPVTPLQETKNVWEFLLAFVSVACIAGITEELCFRGTLLPAMTKKLRVIPSILLTASVFAMMHGSFSALFYTFLIGCLLGWLTIYSQSIYPAMAYHILNNTIALVLNHVSSPKPGRGLEELSVHQRLDAIKTILPIAIFLFCVGLLLFYWIRSRRETRPEPPDKQKDNQRWWIPLVAGSMILGLLVIADLIGSFTGGMACISILFV